MGTIRILEYNSVHEFTDRARQIPLKWQNTGKHATEGLTYTDVLRLGLEGDDSLVAEAEKLLEQLMVASETIKVMQWNPSVYGAYPVVPEFLAGSPTPMRHRQSVETENLPIGIWVDLTSSGRIGLDTLRRRGIVLLALVLKLQAIRPIELYVCIGSSSNRGGVRITLNTRPLDLASSCFILCNGTFARLPMYALVREMSQSLITSLLIRESDFRAAFDVPEGDLVVGTAHLDYSSEIQSDPVAWINKQLAKFEHRGENEL